VQPAFPLALPPSLLLVFLSFLLLRLAFPLVFLLVFLSFLLAQLAFPLALPPSLLFYHWRFACRVHPLL
jgi:hypothetical protein